MRFQFNAKDGEHVKWSLSLTTDPKSWNKNAETFPSGMEVIICLIATIERKSRYDAKPYKT